MNAMNKIIYYYYIIYITKMSERNFFMKVHKIFRDFSKFHSDSKILQLNNFERNTTKRCSCPGDCMSFK